MATPGQFVENAMLGGYQQGELLRQQRKEQDFQNTANQLFNNRTTLQQKVASLRDANGNPLPGYDDAMKDLASNETAIREHWHPDNNPGMLQKFGHMITDHLGLTSPDARAQAQQARLQGDQTKAQALAAATPLSPAQTALANVKTQGQVQQAQLEQDVKNWRQVNQTATPQQEAAFRKELTDAVLLGRRWSPLYERGKWQVMEGTKDGKAVQWLHDANWNTNADVSGNPLDDSFLDGVSDVHPVTTTPKAAGSRSLGSALTIGLRAYARSHGIFDAHGNPDVDSLTPDQINYVIAMQAKAKLFPTTTTSNLLRQDAQARWVPITETNTKTPGGGKPLIDPLGPASTNWIAEANTVQAATQPTAGTPAAGATPPPASTGGAQPTPTPQNLRQEAEKRKPKAAAPVPGGNPNVRVGQPIMQGRSPASDTANKNVIAAETSYEEVIHAAHNTNPVDSQGVVMSWLKGKVNRVTQTEIQSVRNLGGVFDKFDGNISSIEHGTMTPKQMSWFVKNAKDNLDTARKVASKANSMTDTEGAGAPTSGGDWRSRAIPH